MQLISLLSFLLVLGLLSIVVLIRPFKDHGFKKLLPAILLLFLAISAAYWYLGGFKPWFNYQQQVQKQQQAREILAKVKNPKELIDKLKKRLDYSAKSARGWFLLGRMYVSQQNWQQAVKAFAVSNKLAPNNELTIVNYAYALWQQNHQQFTEQIRQLFNQLLTINKDNPDALAMLAMDNYQQKKYDIAQQYWRRLLKLVPADSVEATALIKAINQSEIEKAR